MNIPLAKYGTREMLLAALICGGFWEMWNYNSLAKWEYAVPFVGRYRVFEMPVLGYAGYLPFGLEVAVVAQMLDSALKRVHVETGSIKKTAAARRS